MTFLSKLGSFLAKGIAILTGVWPLVAPLFGSKASQVTATETTAVNDLTQVGQVVVSAEAMFGAKTGPQKLAAAAPLVVNIVKTSELISGHKIANEALFMQGCTDLTNAVAEILNALSPDGVQSSGQPLPAAPAPTVSTVPPAVQSVS